MPAWMKNRLIVRQDLAFVRFLQAGDDVEQRRFAAPAPSDNDDELALRNFERNVVERVDRLSFLLKPFRNMIDNQLRGWWTA